MPAISAAASDGSDASGMPRQAASSVTISQVAAAVGRFDKANLSASFSRLGPLVKRFPRSQSVRFNLGLLLAWIGQGQAALAEFRKAQALGPTTLLGRDARRFVTALVNAGTGATQK